MEIEDPSLLWGSARTRTMGKGNRMEQDIPCFHLDGDRSTLLKQFLSHSLFEVHMTESQHCAAQLAGTFSRPCLLGYDFTARGRNLHYSSRKDMLVLSGDGRVPASFYRQQKNGSNPTQFSAGRIQYQPKSQDLNIRDFESLDVKDLQTKKPDDNKGLKQ